MTLNHILTITLLLCALLMAGYIDGDTRKHMSAWCDSQEPETAQEIAKFNAYCEK